MPVNKKIELSEEEFNRFFKRVEPVEEGKTPAQYNEPLDITKIDDTAFKKIAKDLGLDSEQMKSERESRDRAEKRNAEAFVRQQKDTRNEARKKRRDDFKRSTEDKEKQLKGEKAKFDKKFGKIYQMIRAVNSAALKGDALQKSFANPDLNLDDKDEVQIVESNTINQENLDKSRELLREAEIFFRENKDKIENLMSSLPRLISAIEGVNYKQEEDVFRKDLRRRYADFEKAENELGQLFNQSNKKFKDVCEKMRIALDDLFNNFTRFIEFTGIQGKIDKEEREKEGLEDAVKTSVAVINRITGGSLSREAVISDSLDNVLGIDYDNPEINKIRGERYLFKSNRSSEDLKYSLLRDYQMMSSIYKNRIIQTKNISKSLDSLDVFERERKRERENYLDYFEKILTLSYESGFLGGRYLDFLQKYQNLREESPKQNDDSYLRVRLARLREPSNLKDEDWEKLRKEYIIPFLEIDTKLLKLAKEIIIAFNNNIDRYNQEQEEKFSNDFASSFGGQMPEFFRKELEEKKEEESQVESGDGLKGVQDKYNKLIEHVNVLKTTKEIKDTEEEIQKLKEELKKLEETKKSIQDEKNIIAGLCGNRPGPSLQELEETKLKRKLDTKKGEVDGLNEKLTQQKDRADRAERDRDAALQDAQQENQRLQDAINLKNAALASARESEREKKEAVRERDQKQQELDEKTEELEEEIRKHQETMILLQEKEDKLRNKKLVIEQLKKRLQESEEKGLNNEEEIARLNEELKRARKEYTERTQELTRELRKHQSETKNLKNKLNFLRKMNGLGIVKYGVLKQRLEEEEAKRKDLERNLGTATTENESLQQRLKEAINTSEKRQNSVNDLTQQLFNSREEAENLQRKLEELGRIYRDTLDRLQGKEEGNTFLKQKLETLRESTEELQQELDEARAEHSQSLGELQQELTESKALSSQEKDELLGIIDGLKEEKSQLEQRTTGIESLQQERNAQEERLASLEEERQSHQERVSELEKTINELQSELEDKKISLGLFESTVEGLQGKLSEQEDLVSLVSMYENKTKALQEELGRRGKDNEELQDELEELREKLKSEGTEAERQEAMQGLESKISELEQEVDRLTEEKGTGEQLHSSAMEELKEKVRELNSEAESRNDSIEQLSAEKKSLEESSSVSLRELNARNIILEEETKKAVSSLAEAENYNAVLEGQLETARQENEKNKGLASYNENLAGQVTEREQEIETLESQREQLKKDIEKEKRRVTEFSSGNKELLLEIQKLEIEKQKISEELIKTKSQKEKLQTNYNEELVYRENLLGQLTEVHENFRNLEREREKLSVKLQSALKAKEILEEEKKEWEAENIRINEENQGLKQQNDILTKTLKETVNLVMDEGSTELKNDVIRKLNTVFSEDSKEPIDDVEGKPETAFSSPLKLQRPKQLSPMSKIKNMRNSRRMAIEKIKY